MAASLPSSKQNPPRLYVLLNISTLYGYRTNGKEWSMEERLRRIKRAGFDGFTGRVPMITRELVDQSGMIFAATVDIGGISEIKPKLRKIKEAGARCVNVQLLDHDTLTPRALEVTRRLMDIADDLQMDVAVEMHRNTCTETPEKMYALAEGYERAEKKPLKITWDFSHPAVIKHVAPPYWDRLAERPDLIQYAQQFHFRAFNGHHAQIPALGRNGKLTPEFKDWLVFAEQVIECWLKAAEPGREMFACPEQIQFGYNLSVFGDLWKDAQAVHREIRKAWNRQIKSWRPPAGR